MKVEKVSFSRWGNHPIYTVNSYDEYREISTWMRQNEVENFLLSSGGHCYVFQVRRNHELFLLRWL